MSWQVLGYVLTALSIFYFSVVYLLILGLRKLENCCTENKFSVSVVVAARNEEKNIANCLKALVAQDYPKSLTEIIIVDDRSDDRTAEIVKSFQCRFDHIRLIQINETSKFLTPKKNALNQAIAASHAQLILTTDADCLPPPSWITRMVKLFTDDVGMVVGFSPLAPNKHGLLNKLMGFESLTSAIVAAGSIGRGKVVTCTGRNLAYRRQLFAEVNGFSDIAHTLSGDDDLFLQLVHKKTPWKIRYCTSEDSIVPTQPPAGLSEFINQRKRHFSAGLNYSRPLKIGYFLFHLGNLSLFVAFVFSIFLAPLRVFAFPLFCLKIVVDFAAVFYGAQILHQQKLLWYFPFWEIFFVMYNTIVGPLGLFFRPKWK